jgi:hypothetical protein
VSSASIRDSPAHLAVSRAEAIVALDRGLLACQSSRDVYAALTTFALDAIPGAEQAGVTTLVNGRYRTHAATAAVVDDVDALQYALIDGPSIEALASGQPIRSSDFGQDARFPVFGRRAAAETPVRSVVSVRLPHHEPIEECLNVYSSTVDAFDELAGRFVWALAGQGALAVVAVRAREQVAQLESALANSRDIGVAMGVLMRANTVTRDEAFELLREASQQSHRKLAEIARTVAETGTLDAPSS